MPEARFRIERPVDYSAIFVNRRSHGVLLDEPRLFESPVQRLPSDSQVNPESGSIGRGSLLVRGNFSSWRPGNGRGQSPFRISQGRENTPMVSARHGRGRDSPSVLPSWYPRTPLRDITHIIRAIERRRGEAGSGDGREIQILEDNCSMVTPGPSVGFKRSFPLSTSKVHKMLLDISKELSKKEAEEEAEADFITPEKKLLNSIDKVEKIVMEEIQKLKSTPLAKREERDKRGLPPENEALEKILDDFEKITDALNKIEFSTDQLPHNPDDDEAIDFLLDLLQKELLQSSTVGAESVQRALNLLPRPDDDATEESITNASSLAVIDVFFVPKYGYDAVKKRFIEHNSSLPIHGEAFAKTAVYRERLILLLQRVSRAKHFSRPIYDAEMLQSEKYEISSIQSLLFQIGKKWVMGVISQLEDGHLYLEDLSASVEIDLSKAYKITTGFFTENTIIMAEGEMQNGVFQVITCGFPPLEDTDKTLETRSTYNFFGGGIQTKEATIKLKVLESQAVDDTFVIMSDIWLDNEEVLRKLQKVFDGFESVDIVPSLFVFMGNFCSSPCNLSFGSYSSLRQQFGKLGRMIGNHPRIKEKSRFLFIPGPDDAGPSTVLPRCGSPNYLTEELRDVIPNAIFSSNPCRVKFYNQEIVFFRQELLYRMRRSSLITPSLEETDDPFQHLVSTIVHQSHLCPLPLLVQPIIWNYDHSLRLYPTPHTIVLGDKSEQKVFKLDGTTCFNPGPFSTDSTFVFYRPSTQEVELSAL